MRPFAVHFAQRAFREWYPLAITAFGCSVISEQKRVVYRSFKRRGNNSQSSDAWRAIILRAWRALARGINKIFSTVNQAESATITIRAREHKSINANESEGERARRTPLVSSQLDIERGRRPIARGAANRRRAAPLASAAVTTSSPAVVNRADNALSSRSAHKATLHPIDVMRH